MTETKRECNTVLTEDCTAQYEQECKTVNEEVCDTEYEQQCSTVYEQVGVNIYLVNEVLII